LLGAQQPARRDERAARLQQGTRRLDRVAAADPLDVEPAQLVARLRHELGFGALAPGEDDLVAVSP
jgi:hypothetical protein